MPKKNKPKVLIANNTLLKSSGKNAILRPTGMLIQYLHTPIALKYLGEEEYGIWVTIVSIVSWIMYFDIGVGNGMRNVLSIEIEKRDYDHAQETASTGYMILSLVVLGIFIGVTIVSVFINWNVILNTGLSVKPVLFICFLFMCINFVLSLYKLELYALQKSEQVALSGVLSQLLNLVGVIILIKLKSSYSRLMLMGFVLGLSGMLINLVYSVLIWHRYTFLIPKPSRYNNKKKREITVVGSKFFIIQLSGLVLFTTDNLLISNLFSPTNVTSYNVVYRLFSVLFFVFMAILNPLWSRFTIENEKKNIRWMKKTIARMLQLWILFSIGIMLLVFIAPYVLRAWLRKELQYDNGIFLIMALYFIAYMYSGIFSTVINGIGILNVQMIASAVSAVLNIPLSILFARIMKLGTTGIAIGTFLSLLVGDVAYTIQVQNHLSKSRVNDRTLDNSR